MFSIKTREILNASYGFSDIQNILNCQYEKINIVIMRLREMSDMENVVHELQVTGECILRMKSQFKQLQETLQDVVVTYENADRRVSDEYDNANIHIRRTPVGHISLEKFNTILKDIPFGF